MAEQAKAHNLSPSVSGDDGEPNPRRRARTPPPPPRQSPRREEVLERVEGSATSTSTGDGEGRRDGEHRLLVYGDGSTPQGALQAAGALLRHPPVVPDPESPAQRWLDDVAKLVMTARQRLDAGGRSSATKASGAATTGSASSRRRARRAAAAVRHLAATPSSTPSTREDLRGRPDARANIERRRNDRSAAHATEGASSSRVSPQHGRGNQPSVPPVGGVGCRAFVASLRNVRWPPRFRPTIAEKYDGSVNPAEWLANPVVVPKANGKLRMCIDYTDLNKACPKDPYPLPRIDQIVDSTAGCDLLCFLDAYSGYHQIRVAREDEEKTAFITPVGTYCYTSMPFGLKNAGPTFQRTTRISLGSQIGRNVEAYVDDLVVKTRNQETLLSDLAETFENLRSARIKLNPDKCVFGVPAGKLLGFLVSARGIEANPEKIRAIERMRPPSKLRDVQCVTGCMAALSRFISRLGEKALPLFKLLKRSGPFTWTEEAERALTQLKAYLSSPPVLVAPEPNEPLLLYLAATPQVVSAALVVERDEDNPHFAHPRPVLTWPGSEQGGEAPESNGGLRPLTTGVGPLPACQTVLGAPDPQEGPEATAGRPHLSPFGPEANPVLTRPGRKQGEEAPEPNGGLRLLTPGVGPLPACQTTPGAPDPQDGPE